MFLSLQLVLSAEGLLAVSQGTGQPPDEPSRPVRRAVLLSLRCLVVDVRRRSAVGEESGCTSAEKGADA